MKTTQELEILARQAGAIVDDVHVVLPHWLHSNGYFNQMPLLTSESLKEIFAEALALKLLEYERCTGRRIKTLIGPLHEGGLWAPVVAQRLVRLEPLREIRMVLTRMVGQKLVVNEENHQYLLGADVAIMNDVLSTGTTIDPTRQLISQLGGHPQVVLAICDRRPENKRSGDLDVLSLFQFAWEMWETSRCPLCPEIPIEVSFGKGKEFRILGDLQGYVL